MVTQKYTISFNTSKLQPFRYPYQSNTQANCFARVAIAAPIPRSTTPSFAFTVRHSTPPLRPATATEERPKLSATPKINYTICLRWRRIDVAASFVLGRRRHSVALTPSYPMIRPDPLCRYAYVGSCDTRLIRLSRVSSSCLNVSIPNRDMCIPTPKVAGSCSGDYVGGLALCGVTSSFGFYPRT